MMYLRETLSKIADTKILEASTIFLLCILMVLLPDLAFPQQNNEIEVIAKNPEVKKASIYQINFSIDQPIQTDAEIKVTFPAAFDLSDLNVAGSSTINGGFDLQVTGKQATLKRSGLGREIKANEKVDVKFAIVRNPEKPNDRYLIEVEVFNNQQESVIKKEERIKIIEKKE